MESKSAMQTPPTLDDLMDLLADAVTDAIGNAEGYPGEGHLRHAMQKHGLAVVVATGEMDRLKVVHMRLSDAAGMTYGCHDVPRNPDSLPMMVLFEVEQALALLPSIEANFTRLRASNAELLAAGDELASAACEVHPTAPSSASIERLHAAIEKWDASVSKSED